MALFALSKAADQFARSPASWMMPKLTATLFKPLGEVADTKAVRRFRGCRWNEQKQRAARQPFLSFDKSPVEWGS